MVASLAARPYADLRENRPFGNLSLIDFFPGWPATGGDAGGTSSPDYVSEFPRPAQSATIGSAPCSFTDHPTCQETAMKLSLRWRVAANRFAFMSRRLCG